MKTLIYVDDLHSLDLSEHVKRGVLGNDKQWITGTGSLTYDEFGRHGGNFFKVKFA